MAEVDARSMIVVNSGRRGIGVGGERTCVEDLAHVDCGGGGRVGDYYAVEGAEGGEGV